MFRGCSVVLLLILSLRGLAPVQGVSRLRCHMLPAEECAFAVDSSGRRCVLKEYTSNNVIHSCETSEISVGDDSPTEYIENEQCVRACGVQKMTVGFSSSTTLSRHEFVSKLCSRKCKHNCPNLVDLYSTLAMVVGAEGKLNTYTELCGDLMHKSSRLIRFYMYRRRQML